MSTRKTGSACSSHSDTNLQPVKNDCRDSDLLALANERRDAAVSVQRHARGHMLRNHLMQQLTEAEAHFEDLEAVRRAKALLARYFKWEANEAANLVQLRWRYHLKQQLKRPKRPPRLVTLTTPASTTDSAVATELASTGPQSPAPSTPNSRTSSMTFKKAATGMVTRQRAITNFSTPHKSPVKRSSVEVACEELLTLRREALKERLSLWPDEPSHSTVRRVRASTYSGGSCLSQKVARDN